MSFAWDGAYAGTPPWDIGRPQELVVRLAEADALEPDVLDAGCGTGENALYLASRGLRTVGVDWSERAISLARGKAEARGIDVVFVAADALRLAALGRMFRSVLDCGLFHTFGDEARAEYVRSLTEVVPDGGRVHVLCFSDREPWGGGPRRVTRKEIRDAFSTGWRVLEIEATRFEARTPDTDAAHAWHATIERTGAPSPQALSADPLSAPMSGPRNASHDARE